MNCSFSELLLPAFYIQTHSHLSSTIATVVCYLMLDWRSNVIAREIFIDLITVYEWQNNLMRYDSVTKSHIFVMSWSKKLSWQNEMMLLKWLLWNDWHMQDEMIYWLWNECRVMISQSTISYLIHKNKWSRKELWRISLNCSKKLRQWYHEKMSWFAAENLIFLDEFIFNEKTDWWYQAYASIDEKAW